MNRYRRSDGCRLVLQLVGSSKDGVPDRGVVKWRSIYHLVIIKKGAGLTKYQNMDKV
jgi:hypothetical protein